MNDVAHAGSTVKHMTWAKKEMDPVLHDILWDGLGKYPGGLEKTTYNKASLASSGTYW